MLVQVNISAAL